jgi:hypothetical protein
MAIKGCINGLSSGFGRVGISYCNSNPNGTVVAVANDVAYDTTNDKYYENTTGTTWAQIS